MPQWKLPCASFFFKANLPPEDRDKERHNVSAHFFNYDVADIFLANPQRGMEIIQQVQCYEEVNLPEAPSVGDGVVLCLDVD